MNGIDAMLAHDATCDPGDEWMFHGEEIDLSKGRCLMALAFVAIVVIVIRIMNTIHRKV